MAARCRSARSGLGDATGSPQRFDSHGRAPGLRPDLGRGGRCSVDRGCLARARHAILDFLAKSARQFLPSSMPQRSCHGSPGGPAFSRSTCRMIRHGAPAALGGAHSERERGGGGGPHTHAHAHLNRWTTGHRLHRTVVPHCLAGCGRETVDTMYHLLCPAMRDAVARQEYFDSQRLSGWAFRAHRTT